MAAAIPVFRTETPWLGETASAPEAPAAMLTGVTKRYRNGVVALDCASFALRCGQVTALLGPNGAGKSTAVRLLMGLSAPSSGRLEVFGQDPRQPETRRRTGVMLQVGRAPEMLRVAEHLEIFRGYYPAPMPWNDLVRAAGLGGLERRFFGELSGGEKQRVLFALALAGDPDLLFLDEPTVGLDIEARRRMWTQIRALADRGKAVLLTTHYLEEADALADRILVLSKGRIVCEGSPEEVKAQGAGLGTHATSTAASVKRIQCATVLNSAQLRSLAGVVEVSSSGRVVAITSTAPEATLRELLALDATLSGLEVSSPPLEDAFLALTADAV